MYEKPSPRDTPSNSRARRSDLKEVRAVVLKESAPTAVRRWCELRHEGAFSKPCLSLAKKGHVSHITTTRSKTRRFRTSCGVGFRTGVSSTGRARLQRLRVAQR